MYICVYNVSKIRYFLEYKNMIIIYTRVRKLITLINIRVLVNHIISS